MFVSFSEDAKNKMLGTPRRPLVGFRLPLVEQPLLDSILFRGDVEEFLQHGVLQIPMQNGAFFLRVSVEAKPSFV